MPALRDHIKVKIDEIEKRARAYMLAIPTSAKKRPKMSSMQQKPIMASKHDMFGYGLIHFDMSEHICYSYLPYYFQEALTPCSF